MLEDKSWKMLHRSYVSPRKSDTDGFADTRLKCPWATMRLVRRHLLAAVMKNKDQICSSWLIGKFGSALDKNTPTFFVSFRLQCQKFWYSSGRNHLTVESPVFATAVELTAEEIEPYVYRSFTANSRCLAVAAVLYIK